MDILIKWLGMSELEEQKVNQVAEDEESEEEEMDIYEAIKQVLKKAIHADGLSRGLNEAARSIDKGEARVCFLADNCDQKDYKNLIKALCTEKNVPLVQVADREALGEWAGLCKIDVNGQARRVVKCSCAVVTQVDEDSNAFKILSNYINSQKK